MSIIITGISIPINCFRCFASSWYNFGGSMVGFRCNLMPQDTKFISNCEGRTKRRDNCPLQTFND